MASNIVDSFKDQKSYARPSKEAKPNGANLGSIALFISDDFDSRSIRSREFNHNLKSKDLDLGFRNIFKLVYVDKKSYMLSQLLHSKLLENLSHLVNRYLLNSKLTLVSLSLGLVLNVLYYTIAKYHYYPVSVIMILGSYLMGYIVALVLLAATSLKK